MNTGCRIRLSKPRLALGLENWRPSRKRQQSSGGRLDILLKNPEDDSMYEVEVMLGESMGEPVLPKNAEELLSPTIRPQRCRE